MEDVCARQKHDWILAEFIWTYIWYQLWHLIQVFFNEVAASEDEDTSTTVSTNVEGPINEFASASVSPLTIVIASTKLLSFFSISLFPTCHWHSLTFVAPVLLFTLCWTHESTPHLVQHCVVSFNVINLALLPGQSHLNPTLVASPSPQSTLLTSCLYIRFMVNTAVHLQTHFVHNYQRKDNPFTCQEEQ